MEEAPIPKWPGGVNPNTGEKGGPGIDFTQTKFKLQYHQNPREEIFLIKVVLNLHDLVTGSEKAVLRISDVKNKTFVLFRNVSYLASKILIDTWHSGL